MPKECSFRTNFHYRDQWESIVKCCCCNIKIEPHDNYMLKILSEYKILVFCIRMLLFVAF